MKVPSRVEEVGGVRKTIGRLSRLNGFSEESVYAIEVAVGEAVANAIRHGSPCGEQDTIEVICRQAYGSFIEVIIEDHGEGFDLEQRLKDANPLSLCEGERGLFLIAALMDEVSFRVTENGGRLFMKKYIMGTERKTDDRNARNQDKTSSNGASSLVSGSPIYPFSSSKMPPAA